MTKEIERKFLIKEMPDLKNIVSVRYERYFIRNDDNVQVRIQKKGDTYEFERKTKINDFEYGKEKGIISEDEFIRLSKGCDKAIIRDSYLISENPEITVKIYHGEYEGLIRAEIEFRDVEELKNFVVPSWLGKEITGIDLGNDNNLIKLSREEFLDILKKLY